MMPQAGRARFSRIHHESLTDVSAERLLTADDES
jgi:hypothetical protein